MPISYEHMREENGHFPLPRPVMQLIIEALERVQETGVSEVFPKYMGDVTITPDMSLETAVYLIEDSKDRFHLDATSKL